MVTLTQSLEHWLWENHKNIYTLVLFGHTELITDDMWKEYTAWCQTDDGRQYLVGGSKYDPNHKSVKLLEKKRQETLHEVN